MHNEALLDGYMMSKEAAFANIDPAIASMREHGTPTPPKSVDYNPGSETWGAVKNLFNTDTWSAAKNPLDVMGGWGKQLTDPAIQNANTTINDTLTKQRAGLMADVDKKKQEIIGKGTVEDLPSNMFSSFMKNNGGGLLAGGAGIAGILALMNSMSSQQPAAVQKAYAPTMNAMKQQIFR